MASSFQIKDFVSIVASMVNWLRGTQDQVTDFQVGSVARTMLEAPAVEIDELYQQMFNGVRQAIPVAVYQAFNFDRLPAVAATGLVRVSIGVSASDVIIPAGTTFTRPDSTVSYTAARDVTIAPGFTTGDVLVVASETGTAGNAPASLAWTVSPAPAGFVSASNLAGFYTGAAVESDDARAARFGDYIQALSRGTVAALEYGAKLAALYDSAGNPTERVLSVSIEEPWLANPANPIGLVNVYVFNGVGSTSPELVSRARDVLYGYYEADGTPVPGWKAAGVKVEVMAADEYAQNITGTVSASTGYAAADLVAPVEDAIAAYLSALPVGADALRAEIIAAAMSVEGVYNFTLTVPAADLMGAVDVKILPGTLTVTAV